VDGSVDFMPARRKAISSPEVIFSDLHLILTKGLLANVNRVLVLFLFCFFAKR
jgi:hypothetical protein